MIACAAECRCSALPWHRHPCSPILRPLLLPRFPPRPSLSLLPIRADGGSDLWQLLGGRGLPGGEDYLKDDRKRQALFDRLGTPIDDVPQKSSKVVTDPSEERGEQKKVSSSFADMEEGFEKEMMGLTGGFPGGETGLKKFILENPAPAKTAAGMSSVAMAAGKEQILRKAVAPPLPLLMPGMTVLVKNPRSPYHMFGGIVQRVSDGRVGVLLEGGNWDKLLTFYLEELERTPSGPPMTNPKSAVLLQQQQQVQPSPPLPAED